MVNRLPIPKNTVADFASKSADGMELYGSLFTASATYSGIQYIKHAEVNPENYPVQ